MDINSTALVKGGAMLTSSSIVTEMVIFNDPIYPYLALIGAFLSLMGLVHDIYKEDSLSKPSVLELAVELFMAFTIGAILTPMFFMFYIHAGGEAMERISGFKGFYGIYNSFWFLLSLLSSWYAFPIWGFLMDLVKSIPSRVFGSKNNGK